jgi:hypothetical protein
LVCVPELCEEWALASNNDCEPNLPTDGVTFMVKYLGSTLVETPSNEEATAEAIKTIITMVRRKYITIACIRTKIENVKKNLSQDYFELSTL